MADESNPGKTEEANQRHSFDEFKMFYESAETVTDRRIANNRFSYSVCLAIVVAIAVIADWAMAFGIRFYIGLAAIDLLALLALLFCQHWYLQIETFKKLNEKKFEVLSDMAPLIEFDPTGEGPLESFLPFEREWEKIKVDGVQLAGRTRQLVLKGSRSEYFIPTAFSFLFAGIILAVAVAATKVNEISDASVNQNVKVEVNS